ncbi:MAG: hypothetical protein E5V62_20135 [Mesorhizobium sp.]|nr:MAG: hypothetical protein E5V62_20135 [Mesorhizobium sp.]
MSFPPVLGAPLRRNDHFEHSYFYLKIFQPTFRRCRAESIRCPTGPRPLSLRASPHKGRRSAVTAVFANGEMSGRTEGGAKDRGGDCFTPLRCFARE